MVLFGGLWRRIPPVESSSRRLFKRDIDGKVHSYRQNHVHSSDTTIRNNDNAAGTESHRTLISYQRDSSKDGESDRGDLPVRRSQLPYVSSSARDELPQGSTLSSQDACTISSTHGSLPADEQEVPSLTSEFSPSEADMEVLKLCLFCTSIYMGVSVVAFSFVFEKWTIIDSVYFAVSTFTTCGYGNLTPTTPAGQ
eukprot:scaffold40119_cov38-Attheya_sp.AAC.1